MKKRLIILLLISIFCLILVSCNKVERQNESKTLYELAVEAGFEGTLEEWCEAIANVNDTSEDKTESKQEDIESLFYEALNNATLTLDDIDTNFFVSTRETEETYDFPPNYEFYSIAYPYMDYEFLDWPIKVELTLPDTLKNKVDFIDVTVAGVNTQNNKYCIIGETNFYDNLNYLETYVGFDSSLAFENQFTYYLVEVQFAYDETPNEEGLHSIPGADDKYFGCIKFAIQAYKQYDDLGKYGYKEIAKETALLIAETHFFGCIYKENMIEEDWYYYPEFTNSMENSPNHWYVKMELRKYTADGNFDNDIIEKTFIYTINKYTGEIVDIK